jgi:hypothetical protein
MPHESHSFRQKASAAIQLLLGNELLYLLAHDGLQMQTDLTSRPPRGTGIQLGDLRWWNVSQRGDVIAGPHITDRFFRSVSHNSTATGYS